MYSYELAYGTTEADLDQPKRIVRQTFEIRKRTLSWKFNGAVLFTHKLPEETATFHFGIGGMAGAFSAIRDITIAEV